MIVSAVYLFRNKLNSSKHQNKSEAISTISPKNTKRNPEQSLTKSIFIPYWNIDENFVLQPSGEDTEFDRYIYFGITAGNQGIDKQEVGFLKLPVFAKATAGKDTYLTLRLLNVDFNKNLLKNESLQTKIIEDTITVTMEKKFTGVVLDLELFSLFNDDITDQINNFVNKFYTVAKSNYKSFTVAIYGDVFYRKRPFDLFFLSKNSDEILVMAYDFSKTIGEPGPNFPFARRSLGEGGAKLQNYDYDFKTMTKDYLKIVPSRKLTVVFGMYGYDWRTDEKKRPITTAKALTLKEIKNKFLNNNNLSDDRLQDGQTEFRCALAECVVKRDDISKETEINYTVSTDKPDEQGIYRIDYHVVWFEDEQSVAVKTDYLQSQGIGSVGYWAYGYF